MHSVRGPSTTSVAAMMLPLLEHPELLTTYGRITISKARNLGPNDVPETEKLIMGMHRDVQEKGFHQRLYSSADVDQRHSRCQWQVCRWSEARPDQALECLQPPVLDVPVSALHRTMFP